MIQYRTLDVTDIPDELVKPLKELTIPGFLMKGYFEDCLDAGRGRVIIAFDSLRPIGSDALAQRKASYSRPSSSMRTTAGRASERHSPTWREKATSLWFSVQVTAIVDSSRL
jgi:hypothetical protein